MPRFPLTLRPFLAIAVLVAAAAALGAYWLESRRAAAAPSGEALSLQLAASGIDSRERAAIEALIRGYILDHPEILPEAMDRLQARETASRLAPLRGAIETPFKGAVLGNPQGTVTLVEFTDFACTYCRSSVKDVEALVAANPDLRVVVRELPIIAPESEPAARMGLAAAAQGRYAAFHKAMFAGPRPSEASIAAAATGAGVDLAGAAAFARMPAVQQELERNLGFARQLGINGTPAWVVNGELISGAVGRVRLQQAVDAARKG